MGLHQRGPTQPVGPRRPRRCAFPFAWRTTYRRCPTWGGCDRAWDSGVSYEQEDWRGGTWKV